MKPRKSRINKTNFAEKIVEPIEIGQESTEGTEEPLEIEEMA